ncbi:MAG: 4-hydroxy-tetrahydrodipicolinate synthase [Alicyclobacillus sp.]|nr:4-hydroxy-tetrahydrodipicolinate synthase [Alicyclobacillus sp.]
MDYGRLVTAMATPFDETGAVDGKAVGRLVDHLVETGTTALVVAGTTGESPTLSHDEKRTLFRLTVAAAAGRIPVIAGTGGNNTAEAVRLSQEAAELGVDGLLLVAPYYNRPSQEGLLAHFRTIAEAVDLPIMLYNVPGRTGVNLDVDTILKLAELPNVTAVKEASGNMNQILDLAARKPDDLLLYSGDDKLTLPMMAVGAYGVVSVASHLVGTEMTEMMNAFAVGNTHAAAVLAGRLLPLFETLFAVSSPSPLKAALSLLGICSGRLRLPLVDAPAAVVERLRSELQRLGKLPAQER